MTTTRERELIKELMREACAVHDIWHVAECNKDVIINNMERSCLNDAIAWAGREGIESTFNNVLFTSYYSAIAYKVIMNLDNATYLLDGIINKTIRPRDVATMSSVELCPAASEEVRKEIVTRGRSRIDDNFSKMHKCPKCGERKAEMQEHQTRAADEMATITLTCAVCQHMWRLH